jgi:hypothetical protein
VTTPRAADALLVGAVKLLVSALVLAAGFRAVSDDDYARIVIAQSFAEAPRLDPSGTSWLPAPFWAYGTAFSLFGGALEVARATALFLGVGAAASVLVAARWLGASRAGAVLAALAAGVFPWSAWLGAAALPEAPTAGLLALGMASLSKTDPGPRRIGGIALGAACFCRYEAWPVAVVFFVFCAIDLRRSRAGALALPAIAAVLPILLWLAHGAARHGDPFFFFRRVASYKHALGGGASPVVEFFGPILALGQELPLLLLVTAALALRARSGATLGPYARGFTASLALVVFLALGAIGGGAATHHAARALLPVWYFLACVLGHAAGAWLESLGRNPLVATPMLLVVSRPWALLALGEFPHRDFELDIGDRARRLGAPSLLIDTNDYGYLAVAAAFRRPNASAPLDDHDPRRRRPRDPFASIEALRGRLALERGAWLVATDAHAAVAAEAGTMRARNAAFSLVEPP